jgi:thiol-disulfide isomerase/thioredoxin
MLLLLSLLLLAPCSARVVELTPSTFDALTSQGSWLIEFYAPWCAHCQKLEPEVLKASGLGGSVQWGRVNAAEFYSLSQRFGVAGYPTFFFLSSSGSGGRQVRPVLVRHHTAEALHAFAQGGWAAVEPLSGLAGPLSTAGTVRFVAFRALELLLAALEPAASALGLPTIVLQLLLSVAAVCSVTGLVICCAVRMGPSRRRQGAHEE